MGEFEDHFGAEADADNIISRNSDGYSRSSWVEKARWFGEPSKAKLEAAIARDEFETWSKSMIVKGYIRGPQFQSHEDLQKWDSNNKRPHVQREGYGGFTIYFTDGKPYENPDREKRNRDASSWINDPSIPF